MPAVLEQHSKKSLDRLGESISFAGVDGSSWKSRVALYAFCITLVVSAVYMLSWAKTGWLAQDDGTLAQSALRVSHGQLPHRDFVERYSGALSFYNAAAFRLFGVNLTALRIAMFLVFLAWV